MKALLAALLSLPFLTGCFAFFIPGSVIDTVANGPKYCVAPGAKVGDRFTFNGGTMEVTSIKGDSQYYCREQPEGRRFGVDAKAV